MLRRVALVKIEALEERIASIISVTRIGELGTSAVTSTRSKTSVLTRVTRRNIPEYDIVHSHAVKT
jgi:hypothetical protein